MSISPEISLDKKVEEEKEEIIDTKTHPNVDEFSNGVESMPKARSSQAEVVTQEENENFFDIQRLKTIPSYASVLNNPKRNKFFSTLLADPVDPIELKQESSIADYETYI